MNRGRIRHLRSNCYNFLSMYNLNTLTLQSKNLVLNCSLVTWCLWNKTLIFLREFINAF
jgi:hypothetical protein